MNKAVMLSFVVILFLIMASVFIKNSNDHRECSQIQETKTLNNGSTVVRTNKHVCKEKYNF
jgi:hypothetical protein